jgi:hypothetical protein
MNNFSGSITAYSITNSHLWEMGYAKGLNVYQKKVLGLAGKPSSIGQQTVKSSSIGSSSEPIKITNECVAYYLVTYWSDGTTDYQYIGGYCYDPCQLTIAISTDSAIRIKPSCDGSSTSGGGLSNDTVHNDVTDPCVKNMIAQVTQKNLVNSIANTFNTIFGTSTTYNIDFVQVPTIADTSAAQTSSPVVYSSGGMDITISFNESIMSGASQEYIAETIFHEVLHANLYGGSTIVGPRMQHIDIAQNYIESERTALQGIFPNLTSSDAYAMILSGLGELYKSDPNYYSQLVSNYSQYGITINNIVSTTTQYKTNQLGTGCVTHTPQK